MKKVITSITVINESSPANFKETLQATVYELQKEGLGAGGTEVIIHNPHMVVAGGKFHYIAVVEGLYYI